MLTVAPAPAPLPRSCSPPVPGHSGLWCNEITSTRGSSTNRSLRSRCRDGRPSRGCRRARYPWRAAACVRDPRPHSFQAEPHRSRRAGMVTGRPHGAEDRRRVPRAPLRLHRTPRRRQAASPETIPRPPRCPRRASRRRPQPARAQRRHRVAPVRLRAAWPPAPLCSVNRRRRSGPPQAPRRGVRATRDGRREGHAPRMRGGTRRERSPLHTC